MVSLPTSDSNILITVIAAYTYQILIPIPNDDKSQFLLSSDKTNSSLSLPFLLDCFLIVLEFLTMAGEASMK